MEEQRPVQGRCRSRRREGTTVASTATLVMIPPETHHNLEEFTLIYLYFPKRQQGSCLKEHDRESGSRQAEFSRRDR